MMKRYTIEQKFKSAAAFLVILILFPYIVSVFVNGVDPEETTNENFYIRVKASEEYQADGIAVKAYVPAELFGSLIVTDH